MDVKELYQKLIFDHGTNPRNRLQLKSFNRDAIGSNRLCGDQVHVFISLAGDIIKEVSFEGEGCAICIAASSVMTEVVKNKSEKNAIVIAQFFNKLIKNKNEPVPAILDKEDQAKLNSFISVGEFPMRIKCATLPWIAAESAIKNNTTEINIE